MSFVPPLFVWLAGTLLPVGALWLLFRGVLRAERCFGYNRALLLLAPVVALALPLLPRPEWSGWLPQAAGAPGTAAAVLLPAVQAASAASSPGIWPGWHWLTALYLLGVAIGLVRLAYQSWYLQRAACRLPREERPGYVLAYTGGQLPTSSFAHTVFWDETAALTPTEAASVLAHELAHVQQGHTYDVLWLEVWRAVLWVNPFAHLLLPALRLTHELLADRAAAKTAEAYATPYATLLARLAAQQLSEPAHSVLLQPFNFSFTLTRIAMLKSQIPVRRWKQWLIFPVVAGLFFVVGHKASAQAGPVPVKTQAVPKLTEAQQKERLALISHKLRVAQRQDSLRTGNKLEPGTMQQFHISNWNGPGEPIVVITRAKMGGPDGTVGTEPGSANNYVPAPQPPQPMKKREDTATADGDATKVYTYVEQMPQLPDGGGVQAIVQAILGNVVYPASEKTEGRIFATFVVAADGTVRDTKIVKGLSPSYDAAVLTAIRQLPKFIPGKQGGQAVAVTFTVPVQFKIKP